MERVRRFALGAVRAVHQLGDALIAAALAKVD